MRYAAVGLLVASVLGFSAARADVIPPGSYQTTCHDFYSDGNVLSATCRTPWGGENYTTLPDYNDCDGDIANRYGRLQCVENHQDDDDGAVPRGSYRATCRNVDVTRGTLTAECQDRNGRWRYTELAAYRSCVGDIYNANGMLGCRRGDDDGGDNHEDNADLPGGSWRFSCRDARVYGTVLYARCSDAYGTWHDTSLDLGQCDGDVSNVGGRLVCGDGQSGAITLYRHAYFLGQALTFTSSVPDLSRYDFADAASSVVVRGGFWELCDRPHYRGQCVVVSRTRTNLRTIGFTDRAESLRRLR